MKPFNLETWQQTADFILAPLVAEQFVDGDNKLYYRGMAQGMMAYVFPEGKHRQLYMTVQSMIFENKPIHPSTLYAELGTSFSQDYISILFKLYQKGSSLGGSVFDANIKTLLGYGARYEAIGKLNAAAAAVTNGDERGLDAVISDAVSSLINTGVDVIQNETAIAMGHDFAEYMSQEPQNNLMTGIELIDGWIGGLGRGDFMAIVAAMKQRKTSLLLNMLLNMARDGKSVALMMLESNKRMVNAMLVSMMAVEYIIHNQQYGLPIVNEHGTSMGESQNIYASSLVKLQRRYPVLGELRAKAIEHGIAELKRLGDRLRIYDRTREGGSLNDNASIHRVCLRDKSIFDTDFIAIDHAQRVNEQGNDYEKLAKVVPYLETLARRENITMCLLAQLKAGEAEGTGDNHSSGVRGGSILDEAVDYMLITGYRQKMPDSDIGTRYPSDALMIGLQHSRYGDGGSGKRKHIAIDPSSGLVLFGGKPLREVNPDNNIRNAKL